MMAKRRMLAALLTAALVFVMAFSVFFLANETDHDCAGEDCPVCSLLAVCETILRRTAAAVIVLTLDAAAFAAGQMVVRRGAPVCADTPVTLNVKLSD